MPGTARRGIRGALAAAGLAVAGTLIVLPVLVALAGPAQGAVAGCAGPATGRYAEKVLSDHPVAFYRLADSGRALCDGSGHGLDGSYAGSGVSHGEPGPPVPGGGAAITTDGTARPATSTAQHTIAAGQDFTLEGWFRSSVRQDQMIVAIGQAGNHQMAGIGPWANGEQGPGSYATFDMHDGTHSADTAGLGIDLYDGHWHYLAGVYQASTITVTLYVDGRHLASQTDTLADTPAPSPIRIGWWVDTFYNQPFTGSLADVAVYPSALSAADVAAHARHGETEGSGLTHLPTPAEAFDNPGEVLASVAIAAAGTAFVAFPATLFNLTFEENHATIAGWAERLRRRPRALLRALLRPLRRRAARPEARPAAAVPAVSWRRELLPFATVVLVGGLLGALLDERFGVNVFSLELFAAVTLAILAGAGVTGVVLDVYHRRGHGPITRHLRAFPLGLVVAAVCVLLSRLVGFEPGYLYGVVCGIAFDRALSRREAGRVAVLSTLTVLIVSVLAWFAWVPVHRAADGPGSFALLVVLDYFLAALFVAGIVGSTIGLLPLRFLPGATIWRANRWVWIGLFVLTLFALVDCVVRSPDAQLADHSPLWLTIALVVVFGGASIAFREYFAHRWRVEHGVRLTGWRDFLRDMIGGRPGEEGDVVSVAGGALAMVDETEPPAQPAST